MILTNRSLLYVILSTIGNSNSCNHVADKLSGMVIVSTLVVGYMRATGDGRPYATECILAFDCTRYISIWRGDGGGENAYG